MALIISLSYFCFRFLLLCYSYHICCLRYPRKVKNPLVIFTCNPMFLIYLGAFSFWEQNYFFFNFKVKVPSLIATLTLLFFACLHYFCQQLLNQFHFVLFSFIYFSESVYKFFAFEKDFISLKEISRHFSYSHPFIHTTFSSFPFLYFCI